MFPLRGKVETDLTLAGNGRDAREILITCFNTYSVKKVLKSSTRKAHSLCRNFASAFRKSRQRSAVDEGLPSEAVGFLTDWNTAFYTECKAASGKSKIPLKGKPNRNDLMPSRPYPIG